MISFHQRITIIDVRRPSIDNINNKLQWFGTSIGLFNLRDKDRSLFRIFIELLKAAKGKRPLSSDEIAFRLKLTRGTVVHHLNKLMESGTTIHYKGGYMLRVDSLESLVDEVERDLLRSLENLRGVAREIDGTLGL